MRWRPKGSGSRVEERDGQSSSLRRATLREDTSRLLVQGVSSRSLLVALAVIVVVAVAVHLRPQPVPPQEAGLVDTVTSPAAPAADLIALRCAVCHAAPEPNVLPKSGWQSFLSKKRDIVARFVASRGLDPKLLLQPDELQVIATYYTALAPTQEDLIGPPATGLDQVPWFQVAASQPLDSNSSPQGYIDVFVDDEAGLVLLSDFVRGGLQTLDLAGNPAGFVPVGTAPARIERNGGKLLVALMEGAGGGKVVRIDMNRRRPQASAVQPLIENLQRPIRAYPAGLFGTRGLLVEEFGIDHGGLRFWPRDDLGRYGPARVIVDASGVVGSGLADLDGDGRDDLVVLVSQEREQLLLLPNLGADVTEPVMLFQGHPGYGFNSLLLADVDGDGRTDIITTNGDNYDIDSGPLKPYHGVRIFLNQGGLRFGQPLFLPFHGVIHVLAEDFDFDGDVDLAALSAFPDHRIRPYQSAMLFEQVHSLEFVPRVIERARGSRWVAAAGTDLDGDGDTDLILAGAHSMSNQADRQWSELAGPNPLKMLVLRNTTRN